MKLSTSTCDLRTGRFTTDEHIRLIRKSGFHHFNLSLTGPGERLDDDNWETTIEDVRKALDETASDCVLAHAVCKTLDYISYENLVEETRRAIIACERLGIPDLVVHPLYNIRFGAMDLYKFNRDFYMDVIQSNPDNTTVHILAENSADGEVMGNCFASGKDLADFLDYMAHPLMGVCWDTAHCSLNRAPRNNQYDGIMALGGYLRALHVSDNFAHGLHWHSFPFNGSINFDSVMCGLLDSGYQGAFNFEASYIMRCSNMPPVGRMPWKHPTDEKFEPRLFEPSLELKMQAEALLYATGKYVLEQYGVFEE